MEGLIKTQRKSPETLQPSFPSGLAECVYTPVMGVSNGLPFPEENAITSQHVLNRLHFMEWLNRVTLRAVSMKNFPGK